MAKIAVMEMMVAMGSVVLVARFFSPNSGVGGTGRLSCDLIIQQHVYDTSLPDTDK